MLKSSDSNITSIPIGECDEPFIDLRNQTVIRFGPPPECEQTAPYYTKMRQTVYRKLCQAQEMLPDGWFIRLYEGFRSLEVQQALFSQEYERVKQKHPLFSHKDIFLEVTRLVSPVKNLDDSVNIPPHNTGGAVDIELVDADDNLIDMGMAIANWSLVHPDICLSECSMISEAAKNNRKLLMDIMEKLDFVNYPYEWWHFSYGDRAWAYYKGKAQAIYGAVTDEQLLAALCHLVNQ